MPTPQAGSASSSFGASAALRLLHTSDVQMDAPFAFLGERGAAHRQQLRTTFRSVTELAARGGYHVLLIAGDLFNDNRPSRASVTLVQDALAALPIPVCLLPGNHDCFDRSSVYRREVFPPNVHILTETPAVVDFPELDLAISGNAVLSHQSSAGGLRGVVRRDERRWNVALAHGNVCIPGRVHDPVRPIQPEDIAACRADYVALGDWHGFADYSQPGVAAFYSGAPEPTSLDAAGSGRVASITLSDQGVNVEPIRVGRTETDRLSLDVAGRSESDLIALIRRRAQPTLMLDVVLRGMAGVDQVIDSERIVAEAASAFYWLRVADQSHLELAHLHPADFPETQVIGQYVRLLTEQIQSASSEADRRRAERALQLGVALLRGREALP
jgi:DNA repair protein SbcD/Mre11